VHLTHSKRAKRISAILFSATGAVAFLFNSTARAADVLPGWGGWWLPPEHSAHGAKIDALFVWIFWITMIAWIGVTLVLVVFMIKYRHRPGRRALYTHGNKRLEMIWTIIPAIILFALALFSKVVWDEYRYAPSSEDPNRAIVLVVGQQFKWNVIYPGPDRKLGRYMMFPRPTDLRWPNPSGDGKPYRYADVDGPAFLPYDKAVSAINKYIDSVNPLGKDFTDPDGKDDDWQSALGRQVILPKNRPIEVQLSSKDVIHDFFLPNFRVKLDAVPGMRGHIYFTATMSSKEREAASRRKYTIDELQTAFKTNPKSEFNAVITEEMHTDGAVNYKPPSGPAFWRYADKDNKTIVRNGGPLPVAAIQKLKDAGVKEIYAFEPGYWDLVCE
jgi:heme/copper-type cytochrome/quinol oxidase subunit 2